MERNKRRKEKIKTKAMNSRREHFADLKQQPYGRCQAAKVHREYNHLRAIVAKPHIAGSLHGEGKKVKKEKKNEDQPQFLCQEAKIYEEAFWRTGLGCVFV
eukprot:TRINITY_DN12491_c0_g1_i1.p1 TRINITY_DN12491_c0_g1~~TRINITY_DN12491_c0_g1_i1.p1  ORF type:complete len:101 (-),score=10.43 TRINITY_DN12491_c0_g1_i1:160-462(-)